MPDLQFCSKEGDIPSPASEEWLQNSDLEGSIEKIMRMASEYKKNGPFEINAPSEISFAEPQDHFSLAFAQAIQRDKQQAPAEQPMLISNLPDSRIIGVAFSTYIIAEAGESLYFIDQHAAHERKIYDALMRGLEERVVSQRLLVAQTHSISHEEQLLLKENLSLLAQMGFEIEVGQLQCKVYAVPQILGEVNVSATLEDILSSLVNAGVPEMVRKDRIAKGACKRAIKGGQTMVESDIRELIRYFLESGTIPNCPHGRPIAVCIPKKDLEISFRRRV